MSGDLGFLENWCFYLARKRSEPSNGYLDTWLILWHFSAIDGGSKIAVATANTRLKLGEVGT